MGSAGHRRQVAFRADASEWIGSGHVSRCLTLADELADRGFECQFICRDYVGHMSEHILRRGHRVRLLPDSARWPERGAGRSCGMAVRTQETDAAETVELLDQFKPEWLVIDHYELDCHFEKLVAAHVPHLMVVDDLANRPHECAVLLDQAAGRQASDYQAWVPSDCQVLCGAAYAMIKPEFATLRDQSLSRGREHLQRILVTMGGADTQNATSSVLHALESAELPEGCCVTVIMGPQARSLADVERCAAKSSLSVEVLLDVRDMAQLMLLSDIAIGAGGMTAWERCCLGVPSVVVVTADNQRLGARSLATAGAALVLELGPHVSGGIAEAVRQLISAPARAQMSKRAAAIVDGLGAKRVADTLTSPGPRETPASGNRLRTPGPPHGGIRVRRHAASTSTRSAQ